VLPVEVGKTLDGLASGGRGLRVYRGDRELGFWEAGALEAGDVVVEIVPTGGG
jgi:voltage-gated potassium channel